jgi:ATP-dependent Clp protease protease subunit
MRIVGIIQDWESAKEGRIVETRCNGFAASAGFLVFVAGTKGYRFASQTTNIMWHELRNFSMMKISTPASSEEEARILKHLQSTADEYIESRGKLSKEDIHEKIKNKEFWITGKQALEYGFVDKLLGCK